MTLEYSEEKLQKLMCGHADTYPFILDVMNTLGSSDTSGAAERTLFELARQAPAWRKVELMGQMYRTVCDLSLSGLRQRFPHASVVELRRRLADILLGPELAARVYGPLPGTDKC